MMKKNICTHDAVLAKKGKNKVDGGYDCAE